MRCDDISILPRWMHRLYASLFGYFWVPCLLCGRYSGGHEWRDRNGMSSTINHPIHPSNPGKRTGKGICPACTRNGYGDQSWST